MYPSSANFDHGCQSIRRLAREAILLGILLGGFHGHHIEAEAKEKLNARIRVGFSQLARFRQIELVSLFDFRVLDEIVLP